MAVCEIHLSNQNVLRKMTSCMVILPDESVGPGPYPVFYLLHGLSDDHTAWTRRTSLERYVEGLPMIVVMPDGGRGWYTDSSVEPTGAFETFILHDLIGFIDRTFRTSMGGYGAVKLALKFPEVFCAAASHSGALVNPEERGGTYEGSELHRIFGDSPAGGANDVFALAERLDRARKPALRIDCGTEDYLLEHNRRFHRHLDRLGIAHEYAEWPGAHNWEYWDAHVQETVALFARVLGLQRT